MPQRDQQERLDEAFERIEETILPCIAMMLETLIDASESCSFNSVGAKLLREVKPGEVEIGRAHV